MSSANLLPSLAHALSGSTGTALSTLATYPLDLVNTRLKVQRQLPTAQSHYTGIADAFCQIYAREGGLRAFFAGLRADVAKSVVDSFLFFLFYNYLRTKRLHGRRQHLRAVEELGIAAVAGAAARLCTTPVGNVVTRRQTARLVPGEEGDADRSFGEVLSEIRREKGVVGLWAGYSASLVLTLNPSVTFFLQQSLTRRVLKSERWDSEEGAGAGLTFVLAAVSKAVATAVTYPFQIARARVQVSGPGREEGEDEKGGYKLSEKTEERAAKATARTAKQTAAGTETIFGTVARIRREEGVGALYDGLSGELLKAFFTHGITMVSKDAVHKLLFRLYFAILAYFRRHPGARARIDRAVVNVTEGFSLKTVSDRSSQIWRERRKTAETAKKVAESAISSGESVVSNVLEGSQRKVLGK
jgi:hypothetical protein